jgi:hypothetical protein
MIAITTSSSTSVNPKNLKLVFEERLPDRGV